ncbi:DUF192 domain-containing protein [Candidatus Pacearchaeota archaeon]|nr:DUF192 domain-containing protein [Candidatus Pacearchaeota archaeon]
MALKSTRKKSAEPTTNHRGSASTDFCSKFMRVPPTTDVVYYIDGKKRTIKAKICDTPTKKFIGLMFQKNSPPLLFVFNKNKTLSIHSLFCKPFRALFLDDKFHATKVIDVKTWKLNISGKGKYLLEIPLPSTK